MKIDVLGQSLLVGAVALLWIFESGQIWTNAMLIILGIWQLASALHLWWTYRYIHRINFFKAALVLVISLPVWIHLMGNWAYLPVVGVLLYYFFRSIRDMIIVHNHPKPFWDL